MFKLQSYKVYYIIHIWVIFTNIFKPNLVLIINIFIVELNKLVLTKLLLSGSLITPVSLIIN